MGDTNSEKKELCSEHSGVCATIEGIGKAVAESSANISRLFQKFEDLSEKFQQKFEDLSRDFQNKFMKLAQRPGWLVCIVISVMGSIISVMGTFILYAHFAAK